MNKEYIMLKNKFLLIALIVILSIFIGNCKSNEKSIKNSTTLITTDGKKIQVDRVSKGLIFHGYENKIVILEVYGDTCPYCIAAIPEYNELQKKYKDNIQIITIESYGRLDRKALQQFAKKHHMEFPTVAKQDSGKVLDYIEELTEYRPERYGVPAILIFNRDGTFAKGIPPQPFNKKYLTGLIERLIQSS